VGVKGKVKGGRQSIKAKGGKWDVCRQKQGILGKSRGEAHGGRGGVEKEIHDHRKKTI